VVNTFDWLAGCKTIEDWIALVDKMGGDCLINFFSFSNIHSLTGFYGILIVLNGLLPTFINLKN
jgi:hypothetical protein